MLLFFPKVYDDELVYSLVSRYHAYSGNITTRATNEELYGVRSYRCSAIIPADLKKLSTVTEPFGISFDDLLYGSTLYPYYGLFAQEDTRKRQYEQMRTGEQRYWASFLGIPRYSHYPRYLRYCPVCRECEIQRFGECYWHRTHQIPAVSLCQDHLVPLRDSAVETRETNGAYIPLGFDCAVSDTETRLRKLPDDVDRQLRIQSDILFCIERQEEIRQTFLKYSCCFAPLYLELLKERGYATENGSLRPTYLAGLKAFWGEKRLEEMGLAWENVKRPWPISICRRNKLSFDPIKHILMAQFLVGSMERLICQAEARRAFLTLERQHIQYHQVADFEEKRERYRERWTAAMERAEKKTITSIQEQDMPAATWLRRHDKQWLKEHSPPPQKRGGNSKEKDWISYDAELSLRVAEAATRVREKAGKPVRITAAEIVRNLGITTNYYTKNKRKLPKTEAAIQAKMETTEEWHERKIRWAVEEKNRKGGPLIFWEIMRLSGIRDNVWEQYREFVVTLISQREKGVVLYMEA